MTDIIKRINAKDKQKEIVSFKIHKDKLGSICIRFDIHKNLDLLSKETIQMRAQVNSLRGNDLV